MSERPYSRVYWSIRDDERFAGVYGHDGHLATWLRLLIAADAVWPHPADVPASARRRYLEALAAVGLIELLPGRLFRVHGLDRERERRSHAARASASARWDATAMRPHSDRTPVIHASQAEPSQAEPSQARAREAPDDDPAVTWMTLAGRFPSVKARKWLDDLSAEYGSPAVSAALASVWPDSTPSTAIGMCQDRLKASERATSRKRPRYGLTADQQAMAAFLAGGDK